MAEAVGAVADGFADSVHAVSKSREGHVSIFRKTTMQDNLKQKLRIYKYTD